MTQQEEITNLTREIEALQTRINILKKQQNVCNHRWSQPLYNAEKYNDQIVNGYSTHGVHLEPKISYVSKTKDRWTRKCAICGLEQHTYDNPNPKPKINWN